MFQVFYFLRRIVIKKYLYLPTPTKLRIILFWGLFWCYLDHNVKLKVRYFEWVFHHQILIDKIQFSLEKQHNFLMIIWTTVNKIWTLLAMHRAFILNKNFRLFWPQAQPSPWIEIKAQSWTGRNDRKMLKIMLYNQDTTCTNCYTTCDMKASSGAEHSKLSNSINVVP